jgi:hypothetical protein
MPGLGTTFAQILDLLGHEGRNFSSGDWNPNGARARGGTDQVPLGSARGAPPDPSAAQSNGLDGGGVTP